LRGRLDLFGRTLQVSMTGFADEIAAAASLLHGPGGGGAAGWCWCAAGVGRRANPRPALCGRMRGLFRDRRARRAARRGAKLALGLSDACRRTRLLVVANTGDDFEHLGSRISPDIDTLTYALAGLDNQELGWGGATRAGLHGSAGEHRRRDLVRLGDRDLALHVERTRRLRAGETLSAITRMSRGGLASRRACLPMSDDPVRTRILSEGGWIDFQYGSCGSRRRPPVRPSTSPAPPWRGPTPC
jgi:hypothetical protein